MNLIKPTTFICVAALLLASCQRELKYHYAIRDFRQVLQPALEEIVSKGIVGYGDGDNFLQKNFTDDELAKLSYSEHPVLRATALRLMTERPSFDNFDLVMGHLDDTALIKVDNGEFGIGESMVSDDLIRSSRWKTIADKNKTIDAVIKEHNYLRSAYWILDEIDPKPEYYFYAKKMVEADMNFTDIERALYFIARYKKGSDIIFIKQFLMDQSHFYKMTENSFALMCNYADSNYMPILQRYYPRNFYKNIYRHNTIDDAVAYIMAVAVYKNLKSAEILESILDKKPIVNAPVDTFYIKSKIIEAIKGNSCPAYTELIKKIRPQIIEYDKSYSTMPVEYDTTKVPQIIRW